MSQEKFIKINGARPSPLKINKESHTIQKPSDHHHQLKMQRNQPLIIYAHSPKIIHTQPRDFMAVVQRLTGMNRPNDDDDDDDDNDNNSNNSNNNHGTTSSQRPESRAVISNTSSDNNESSSILTDEINNGSDRKYSILNTSFADIPLFTPNASSADFSFFFSPRQGFRFLDTTSSSSPNILRSSALSPSFWEFMKRLPEY